MDRNAKLRTTLGTANIHQQSSPLNYHKYREIHYNLGDQLRQVATKAQDLLRISTEEMRRSREVAMYYTLAKCGTLATEHSMEQFDGTIC